MRWASWADGGSPAESLAVDPRPNVVPFHALSLLSDATLKVLFHEPLLCFVCDTTLRGRQRYYCSPECMEKSRAERAAAKRAEGR